MISDCHNTAQYAFDHDLRAPERTVVHWDCVDVARFAPLPPGGEEREAVLARYGVPPAAGRFTVLTLGRMASDTILKGYDRLIDVFARIPREVPIRLILEGDGARRADRARAQLRALPRAHRGAARRDRP